MPTTILDTATDYKKYVFAQGQSQIWRAEEIVRAIERTAGIHPESTQDLSYLLDSVMQFLWHAAFVDAARAAVEEEARKARAKAAQEAAQARPPLTEADFQVLRERLRNNGVQASPRTSAQPPREPFNPAAIRARQGMDTYADGRPVTTTVRFGDADDDYVTHVWHPDPEHAGNQPGAEHEFSRGPWPYRFGMVEVTVPGSIRVLYDDENNILEKDA